MFYSMTIRRQVRFYSTISSTGHLRLRHRQLRFYTTTSHQAAFPAEQHAQQPRPRATHPAARAASRADTPLRALDY